MKNEKKQTWGGKRKGAGRKSLNENDKKQPLFLYVEASVIEKNGGQKQCRERAENYLKDAAINS